MSVVLDRPEEITELRPTSAPVALKPRVQPQPEYRPTTDIPIQRPLQRPIDTPVQTPARVKRQAKVGLGQTIGLKAMMFTAVFSLTYVGSTLTGHYLVEKSRNQSIAASNRATSAIQAEREVQQRLDTLTSASSIEDWALSHGFRPTDGLGQTSKVVNIVPTDR
jgi:hypothetical protein